LAAARSRRGSTSPPGITAGHARASRGADSLQISGRPEPAPASTTTETEDDARTAIRELLRKNDKAGFRARVSKQNLERRGDKFDEWYELWRANSERDMPEWKTFKLVAEDGVYKLDEN
jgi:hypothetical protein